jgi:uroporphyrinogen III methyltransferase/synthase
VRDVAVYETRLATSLPAEVSAALDAGSVHWITFTSSSTARNFVTLLGPDYQNKLASVKLASIGPVTTATLAELRLYPTIEAHPHTISSLANAIAKSALNVPSPDAASPLLTSS